MSESISEQNKSTNELVSVVVPIYGVAQYLRQCLDSIINQSYKNLEIILVDDGSIDGSAKICDEYATKDNRIVVIHKKNGGLVSARKAGVEICNGEYTAYVDGDDWISTDYIEELTRINKTHKVDMIVSNFLREGKKQEIGEKLLTEGYYDRIRLENEIFPKMLYAGGFYQFGISQYPHKIFRTQLLKKFQLQIPDDISLGEDVALTYPMLLECSGIYVCNEPLYHYRFNEEGISLKYRERTASDTKNLIEFLRKKMPEKYGLSQQVDYYNCLMALTNIVNTARGGFSDGFQNRVNRLIKYLEEIDLQSSLKRCDFTRKRMTSTKRMGLIFMKLKMYRTAVLLYSLRFTVTGGIRQ